MTDSPTKTDSPNYEGGYPLGERDSGSHQWFATGVGANVETLTGSAFKRKQRCFDDKGREVEEEVEEKQPAYLDGAKGGLSLTSLNINQHGVPDLSHASSPTTTAESSGVRTPPAPLSLAGRSESDLLKPTIITRADSETASATSSATPSAVTSEDEGPSPVKRKPPIKESSVSSTKTVVPSPPLVQQSPSREQQHSGSLSVPASPRPPPTEKKPSTIGKLLHHKSGTSTASTNASTTSLGLTSKGPPPAKSAGKGPSVAAAPRSPALPSASTAASGDESDGHSETSASSGPGSALRALGRRMSNKTDRPKDVNGDATVAGKLDRKVSQKKAAEKDETSKLERKASGKQEHHMTLKEYVAAHSGGLMQRKASSTSHKSDEDRSEKGSNAGDDATSATSKKASSTYGDRTTASLLKKYGVCEKTAIGKGATAVVRLAHKWDRSTERLYAVKEFRKRRKNETEREYVKKLTSEFCISSTLHHAHVVETVDLVQDENHHWCEVMEYCPGGDLYAAIKKGDMTQSQINSYFKQTVLGIAYLHSMGVAHRDIKPENLLLDAKGYVKITDFGVSDVFRMCWEKQTHLSKGLCGSEPYIAPEQFEQKEYDARMVDVWAVAIVFYCMVAQELPWRAARSSDATFAAYCERYDSSPAPAPLSSLTPKECRGLVKKMLCPSPKSRIMIEQVAEDAWLKEVQIKESTPPFVSGSLA